MKLKDLKSILQSRIGDMQWAIVWDATICEDLEVGCSIDYAIANYGDREVYRIKADHEANLIIELK